MILLFFIKLNYATLTYNYMTFRELNKVIEV